MYTQHVLVHCVAVELKPVAGQEEPKQAVRKKGRRPPNDTFATLFPIYREEQGMDQDNRAVHSRSRERALTRR